MFREGRLDEEVLTRACEGYAQITGDPVHTAAKRNLVAIGYRVHADDFLPFVAHLFTANGTATNLLGILRWSPPRNLASAAPTDAPQGQEADVGRAPTPVDAHGREAADVGRPWTIADIDEALGTAHRDRLVPDESESLSEPADADLRWRVEAMRRQVPEHGPIPELRARPDDLYGDSDDCVSCGERLFSVRSRCAVCNEAARFALGGLG